MALSPKTGRGFLFPPQTQSPHQPEPATGLNVIALSRDNAKDTSAVDFP
jgi:hypothetical protein